MLPLLYRLYFWGAHGVFLEVVFTGVWEFVVTGKWRLMGTSSIWSFLIYGVGFCLGEAVRDWMIRQRVSVQVRCLLYVFCVYAWELAVGALLGYFGARPWDYTAFDYDLMGLVTLEYAPIWFFGGVYFEILVRAMSNLERVPVPKPEPVPDPEPVPGTASTGNDIATGDESDVG